MDSLTQEETVYTRDVLASPWYDVGIVKGTSSAVTNYYVLPPGAEMPELGESAAPSR